MKSDFYVYIHRKKTNNEIYYVGKGRNKRAWVLSQSARNPLWNKIHKKHGTTVEIVLNNLTEFQAHSLERELILFYGRRNINTGSLANLTDGGEGTVGFVASEEYRKNVSIRYTGEGHPRYDKRIWTFYNVDTEEVVRETRYKFTVANPHLNVDTMFHGPSSSRRWVVKELFSEDRLEAVKNNFSGKWNPNIGHKRWFVNITTLEEKLEYPSEMTKLLGTTVNNITLGKNFVCKGWTTKELIEEYGIDKIINSISVEGLNNPRADKNIYKFINYHSKNKEECTRFELQEKYNINIVSLFNKKPSISAFGWMLESTYLEGKKPRDDLQTYIFENETLGTILECSRQEFKKLTGVSCKRLFHEKPYKTVAGWKLIKD